MKPTAAPAHWPYLDHRTLAEVYEAERDANYEIAALDLVSRHRALSDREKPPSRNPHSEGCMTDDRRELARQLLQKHSVSVVVSLLNNSVSGEKVAYSEIDRIRRHMVKDRELERSSRGATYNDATQIDSYARLEPLDERYKDRELRSSSANGSAALLRAQLRTGFHWITDPVSFGEACASVGLAV